MLTALELAGFKSFAEKTRLEFPAGVTCVVGPNGSGKSNVVDAIKWVMGSQSPKSLRGGEMTDVIFSGTAARRPLNAAEVTLEFDNRSGIFDLQHPQVRITRRVYRSGEGEYALNGAACRLKDIRELLAGTGAGAESYCIIEQGRVDAVLRASPKERRTLFEEAAGVSRFRIKKQEAARRLARVEQNLLRLSDIVDEVEGRLRRVRSQAGKARKYREHTQRVEQLRTQLGLVDWWAATTRLEELDQTLSQLDEACSNRRQCIVEDEAKRQEFDQRLRSQDAELAEVERQLAHTRERIAAVQASARAESRRLAELIEELSHARRRVVAARIEAASRGAGQRPQELRNQLTNAEQELYDANATLEAATRELQSLQIAIEQHRDALAQAQQTRRVVQSEIAELTRTRDQLVAREEVNREQLAAAQQSLTDLKERQAKAEAEYEKASQESGALQEESQRLRAEQHAADSAVEQFRGRIEEQRRELAQLEATIASDRRRVQTYREEETRLERLQADIARLLGPSSQNVGAPAEIRGFVADLLHVDFDTAPMIEAALGERSHHLVVDRGEGLLESLTRDATGLTTRASFQRLDCEEAATGADRIDLSKEPGVMGRADQFVEADAQYAPLVTRLLGRTWLVDTLATARRLAATVGRGLNFATFAGECLAADGTISLGQSSEPAGMFTRRKEIEKLADSLEVAQRQAVELTGAIAAGEAELKTTTDELAHSKKARAALAEQLAANGRQVSMLAERRRHLAAEQTRLEKALSTAVDGVQTVEQRLAEGRATQTAKSTELAASETEIESLRNAISQAERALAAHTTAVSDARVEVAKQEQHTEILAAQAAQVEQTTTHHNFAQQETLAAAEQLRARLEESELEVLRRRSELAEQFLTYDRLVTQQYQMSVALDQTRDEVSRIDKSLARARQLLDRAATVQQQAGLDAERLRLERQTLVSRMQEDYGIDLPEAARQSGPPEVSPTDRPELEQELATLRGEVNTIGAINLESLEELDELESRFAELSSQYRDLAEAKGALEKLSSRISQESRHLFLTTVEEVRGHFRDLFRRLFGGGEADIVLQDDDGDDPLEAGVEIEACPPGKELRTLSLMSGGEKTMTCVALLLAVFRTKPSPFCVLDEVDAALDEANIGRFTGVLSEFLSATQFIVVTHSKKTMTGADTLYGVTMQESGVSKQVAVRFEDVGEDGQINPTATLRRAA